VIIGTAGHIDHGKTALLAALTGIDADRLPEEKARGITIDIGFAHLEEEETRLSFIDAPGHERFVRNMLAGAGGLDALLLVVAADEGVRPQTREHVAIAELLGLSRGVVALTKCDRVPKDRIPEVLEDLAGFLHGTFLQSAPVLPVSAKTGKGIAALRRALLALAERETREGGGRSFRLPVDRAFSMTGFGPVVTGSLVSGSLSSEERIEILPERLQARVRRVEVHGRKTSRALAGERTSVNLAGVELEDLRRGQMLVAPESLLPSRRLLVVLKLLPEAPALETGAEAVFFHFASETTARLRLLEGSTLSPGGKALALLTLREPVGAVVGDRFVLRRPSPSMTLGGGEIRDTCPPRRLEAADRIAFSRDDQTARLRRRIERERAGIFLTDLSRDEGLPETEMSARLAEPALAEHIVLLPPRGLLLSRARLKILSDRARDLVAQELQQRPGAIGAGTALVLEKAFAGFSPRDGEAILSHLVQNRVFDTVEDEVRLPGQAALPERDRGLAREILRRFDERGLEPPTARDLSPELGAKEKIVEGLIAYLLKERKLIRLPGGVVVSAEAVEKVSRSLRASGRRRITVPEFKQMFKLTRRMAIPLLEHLDERRITRRQGDLREILSAGP
jgi:selenocysteine-specific elongation factor